MFTFHLHNHTVISHRQSIHGLINRLLNLLPITPPLDKLVNAAISAYTRHITECLTLLA